MTTVQNRYYSNTAAITTLLTTGGINATATSFSTASQNGWPGSVPFVARFEPNTANEELVLVTGGSGTSGSPYTCTRGYDGTTAVTHAQGVTVSHGICQIDIQDPQVHLNLRSSTATDQYSFTAHGLPASVWNGTAISPIQTLSASGSSNNVVFSGITNTYNHLRVMYQVTGQTNAGAVPTLNVQFNGDISNHYTYAGVSNVDGTGGNPENSSFAAVGIGLCPGPNDWAFGYFEIINYASTTIAPKGVYGLAVAGNVSSHASMYTGGGVWVPGSATAITSITISVNSSSINLNSNSTFELFGIL